MGMGVFDPGFRNCHILGSFRVVGAFIVGFRVIFEVFASLNLLDPLLKLMKIFVNHQRNVYIDGSCAVAVSTLV